MQRMNLVQQLVSASNAMLVSVASGSKIRVRARASLVLHLLLYDHSDAEEAAGGALAPRMPRCISGLVRCAATSCWAVAW